MQQRKMFRSTTTLSDDLRAKLRDAAATFSRPSIFAHPAIVEVDEQLTHTVPHWEQVKRRQSNPEAFETRLNTLKRKIVGAGRSYTSQFRGVHQTFPTERWEAQFRRSGKPTSLGCFDEEEEAARAYDKMQLWLAIHHQSSKGTTNFKWSEYEHEMRALKAMSQDELIRSLRGYGRNQAAERSRKLKREGRFQIAFHALGR